MKEVGCMYLCFPLILVVFSTIVYCSVWVYMVYHLFLRRYHFTWFFYYHFDHYYMIKVEACIDIVGVMHYIYIEGLNLWAYFAYALHLGSIDVMLWVPSICTHYFYGFSMIYWSIWCDVMFFEPPTDNGLDP